MLPFSKARQIAEAWVAITMDDTAEIVRKAVLAKSYGWIFFYQSSAYLRDPSGISAPLAGNAPFVVNRVDGEVRVLGTARFEARLAEYERALPPDHFYAEPEAPSW